MDFKNNTDPADDQATLTVNGGAPQVTLTRGTVGSMPGTLHIAAGNNTPRAVLGFGNARDGGSGSFHWRSASFTALPEPLESDPVEPRRIDRVAGKRSTITHKFFQTCPSRPDGCHLPNVA